EKSVHNVESYVVHVTQRLAYEVIIECGKNQSQQIDDRNCDNASAYGMGKGEIKFNPGPISAFGNFQSVQGLFQAELSLLNGQVVIQSLTDIPIQNSGLRISRKY